MIRRFLVVLALGGVVLAACSGDSTSTEDQVTEEPTPQAETPTTDAAVVGGRRADGHGPAAPADHAGRAVVYRR